MEPIMVGALATIVVMLWLLLGALATTVGRDEDYITTKAGMALGLALGPFSLVWLIIRLGMDFER